MRPLILVTNDDGMFAPGIKALVEVASQLGEVVVVAPDSPQSGQGHAITLTKPLRLNKVHVFEGIDAYECSGTPVDCVKLAKHVLLKDRKIDLCVSGINHGSNASINIIYSGTMSAAMEASLESIPSIGFSYLDYSFDADFSACKVFAHKIIRYALQFGFGNNYLLNVNIPKLPIDKIQGIKVCRQAEGNWKEEFIEGKDPRNQTYYWLTGIFELETDAQDTDIWALENGFVSVVPSAHDLTDHQAISPMKSLENLNNISMTMWQRLKSTNHIGLGILIGILSPIVVYGILYFLSTMISSDGTLILRERTLQILAICSMLLWVKLYDDRFTGQTQRGLSISIVLLSLLWFTLHYDSLYSW